MSNKISEYEIHESLKRLSELESKIKSDIESYNRLSSQLDTNKRLALLSSSVDEDSKSELEEELEEKMTHDEYVQRNDYPPSPWIKTFGADCWFPSDICLGY